MSPAPLSALRQFVRKGRASEACDSCGAALPDDHSHSFESRTRSVRCCCAACLVRYANLYTPVPRQVRALPAFQISASQWDELTIPISLAFLSHHAIENTIVACYPSVTGVIETIVPGEAWRQLCAINPELRSLQPDVEALLINRVSSQHEYWIAPIDECYKLAGVVKQHWRGFAGGTVVWAEIASFFQELNTKRLPPNFGPLQNVANAVLYEGFLLYPYRKSSLKNQRCSHLGTIELNGLMQTECVVQGDCTTTLTIKIRFLQEEAEREILLTGLLLGVPTLRRTFYIPPLECSVEIESRPEADSAFCVTVRVLNAGGGSMASTHTLLGVQSGTFVSLLDPPERYQMAAARCRNIGTWPVLAGVEGERTLMLSSPISLYDYPKIAPASPGDLFDGSEIHEILNLRILTLSVAEKEELREAGGHGAQILHRTEELPAEAFAKMHGAMQSLQTTGQREFRPGDQVRLRPRKRADIFDIVLNGRIAIVESVEQDFEDRIHLAVSVADDPGRDLGAAGYMGHRFFFSPDEVELL